MGKKKSNHYVPRCLLRRFASKVDDKKSWVWHYRAGHEPFEASTRGVGFKYKFYGDPENGVEDRLEKVESRYAVIFSELEAGRNPNELSQELRVMVHEFALRTQAFRQRIPKALDTFAGKLGEKVVSHSEEIMRADWGRNREKHLREAMKRMPGPQRAQCEKFLRNSHLFPGLEEKLIQMAVAGGSLAYSTALEQVRKSKSLETSAKNQQVDRLRVAGISAPEKFLPTAWEVMRFDDHALILGDGCVVAVSKEGEAGSLFRFGSRWETSYLPISHRSLLVAYSQNGNSVRIDAETVNRMSAQISAVELFASRDWPGFRALAGLINTGDYIRSDSDWDRDVAEGWRRFIQGSKSDAVPV